MKLQIAKIDVNYIQLDLLFFGLDIKIDVGKLLNEFGLFNEQGEIIKRGFNSYQEALNYLQEMEYKEL
jgi:hypothetical protein